MFPPILPCVAFTTICCPPDYTPSMPLGSTASQLLRPDNPGTDLHANGIKSTQGIIAMGSSHQNVKAVYLHDDEILDPIAGGGGVQKKGPILIFCLSLQAHGTPWR